MSYVTIYMVMHMDYQLLGRNIRAARKKKGLTQEQLAEAANISVSFLGHIERGTRVLSVETLVRLADALMCSIDDLTGRFKREQLHKKERMLANLAEIMRFIEKAE